MKRGSLLTGKIWPLHLLFAAGVVGIWQLLVLHAGNEVLFPTLWSVGAALWDLTSSGKLHSAMLASLQLLFTGFSFAFVGAFV